MLKIGLLREGPAYAAATVLVGGFLGYMVMGDFGLRPDMPRIGSTQFQTFDVPAVPVVRSAPSPAQAAGGADTPEDRRRGAPRASAPDAAAPALPTPAATDGARSVVPVPSILGPPNPLTCPERGPASLLHPLLDAFRKVKDVVVGAKPKPKPAQAACGPPRADG